MTTSSSLLPQQFLTSVRQPRQELGRTATELVVDEATNPDHTHT
jgi:LacI family transcriptional regulator